MGAEESVVKQTDDSVGLGSKPHEGRRQWAPGHDFGFVERYIRGELKLGLLLSLGDAPQYGFTINVWKEPVRYGMDRAPNLHAPHNERGRASLGCQKPPMLTQNVKLMEAIQRVVPSVVWLDRFDKFPRSAGQLLYKFIAPIISIGEIPAAVCDGEVDLVWEEYWFGLSPIDSPCENIEAASQGVDIGTGLDIERERERLFLAENKRIVEGVRWYVSDDHIDVAFEPELKPLLKEWNVGYGPIYT